MVRRCDLDPGQPGGGRCGGEKGSSTSRPTTPWADPAAGFGTKLHLVVDGRGVPLSAVVTAGEAHESKALERALEAVRLPRRGRGRPRRRPRRLAGDKGSSDPQIRRYLRRRGIVAVIPTRADQRPNPRFDKAMYRRRNVVERCVMWLKESRRLATRFEKLAVNFLAMAKLAMIRRCMRILESPNRT